MKTLLVVMVAAMTACGQSVHRGTWTGKGTATYSNAQGVPPVGCGPPLYLCSRTDKLSAPIPTAPNMGNLVGAGMCVNDPDFASKVCRITDSTTNPSTMVSGYGGDGDRNEFNTDSTKLFVESVNGPVYPMNFDPATMAATRMYGGWGLSISSPAWSHTNKDVFYGVAVGPNTAKYLKYDTSGGSIPTPTVAADFTGANCFNGTTPAFVFSAGVSNDDQIFVLGFSDSGGQGGDGAKYVAAYKVGSGCRMLNTVTGVISGDWGPTGAVPNWTAMTDSDGILLHSLAMSKDGAWISIVAHVPSCPTCGTNGNYFWQMATTNVVQPSGNLGGHITEGFTHWINGAGTIGQFQSRLYSDPGVRTGIIPTQNFPPLTYPYDLHVGWNNVDTNDTYPFCGTEYQPQSLTVPNVAWYKEIFCVSPIDGTVWRFAHTFDTSLSLRFSDTDAIGTVSQDGRFYMWSSDWMGTLGSENGVASCTVGGPVNGAGCRGDVFIVNLAGGGQTFYASPSGSDTNPGSLAQPVQTIPALKALVRNKPGSTAVLRAGTYALTLDNTCGAGLCLDSGDSGVTWESFPGEKAVLSGGTRLTGWVNTTGNQWTHTGAGLSDAEVLFYDGAFRYKPRLGSGSNVVGTQYRIAGVDNSCGGLCYDRFFYDPADTAVNGTWTNLNNSSAPCSGSASSYPVGDITITYMRDFNGSRARVKCRNATTHEIYLTGNITNNYGFAVGRRYSVENVENAAGTDTQWYWNKVTNIITYYAALGENPNTHEVIIPQTAPPLISATGLTNTTFQGLTFSHDNLVIPATGYQGQQSDFTLAPLFHCNNCSNDTWEGDTFTATTSHALRIDTDATGTCTTNTVKNSAFHTLGGGGIYMGRFPPSLSDTNANICQSNVARNNRVKGIGRLYPFSGAILSLLEQHTKLLHNEVDDGYSYGMVNCIPSPANCGIGTTSGPIDTEIGWNKGYNFGQGLTYDFGIIYVAPYTATSQTVHDNIVHHANDGSKQDAAFGFSAGAGAEGIYIDNVSQDVFVTNNLVYKTTNACIRSSQGPQTAGHPNVIDNNILAFCRTGAFIQGLAPPSALQQVILRNNLIYVDKTYSDTPVFLMAPKCGPFGSPLTAVQLWNPNLYFNPNTDISAPGYTNLFPNTDSSCVNTGYYSKVAWVAAGEDTTSLWNVNPGFVNVGAENFTLTGASQLPSFAPFSLTVPGLENPTLVPAVPASVLPGWPIYTYLDADY